MALDPGRSQFRRAALPQTFDKPRARGSLEVFALPAPVGVPSGRRAPAGVTEALRGARSSSVWDFPLIKRVAAKKTFLTTLRLCSCDSLARLGQEPARR
jgi:hypothetical protein